MKILLSMLSKYIPSSHAIFYNKVPDSLSGKYSSGFEKNKSCDSIEWCCKVTAVAKVKSRLAMHTSGASSSFTGINGEPTETQANFPRTPHKRPLCSFFGSVFALFFPFHSILRPPMIRISTICRQSILLRPSSSRSFSTSTYLGQSDGAHVCTLRPHH